MGENIQYIYSHTYMTLLIFFHAQNVHVSMADIAITKGRNVSVLREGQEIIARVAAILGFTASAVSNCAHAQKRLPVTMLMAFAHVLNKTKSKTLVISIGSIFRTQASFINFTLEYTFLVRFIGNHK